MASLSPTELDARLRLHALPELGAVRQRLLLDAFGSVAAALNAPASAWRALRLPALAAGARRSPATRERVDEALAWLDGPERHLLCLGDDRYPALLAEIADPPRCCSSKDRSSCSNGRHWPWSPGQCPGAGQCPAFRPKPSRG